VVTWVIFWGIYGLLRGGIDLLAGLEPIQLVFATLSGMAAGAVFGAIFGFFGLTGDNPSMDLMMPKLPGVVLGGLGLGLVAYNLKWTALVGPAIVVGMFAGAWLWDKSFPKRRPANPTSPAEAEKKEKREKK
jgi:hypothetical protein